MSFSRFTPGTQETGGAPALRIGQLELFRNLGMPLLRESIAFRIPAHRRFLDAAVFQWPKARMTVV